MSNARSAHSWVDRCVPSVVAALAAITLVAGLTVAAVADRTVPPPALLAEPDGSEWTGSASAVDLDDLAAEPAASEAAPPDEPQPEPADTAADAAAQDDAAPEIPPLPEPDPEPEPAPPPAEPEAQVAAAGADGGGDPFAEEFPLHAAARQTDDPATHNWAVLVGVNRYAGRTQDTLGSVADALAMREVLLGRGWRDEHILVLTDEAASRDRIVRAIEWLARSTDERSTVVFSFSGHLRHQGGVTAVWPTDNRFVWADEFGRLMGTISAGRMWVALQGCHAEGLRAPGLEGEGRLVTYSSKTAEKSYEDPEVGHSVYGFYVFVEGLQRGWGDADGDGRVSVQEAFEWGAPRAHTRTANLQTPVISDQVAEPFHLEVTRQRSPAAQ